MEETTKPVITGDEDRIMCKICKKIVTRIHVGNFNDKNKSKKYVDETGKLFNGHQCPSCVRKVQKKLMREKRKKNKVSGRK